MNKNITDRYKIDLGRKITRSLVWFMCASSLMIAIPNPFPIVSSEILSISINIIFYVFFIITALKNLFDTFSGIRKISDQEKRKSLLTKVMLLIIGFFVILMILKFFGFAVFIILFILYTKFFLYDYI